jgi:hypothetical protein
MTRTAFLSGAVLALALPLLAAACIPATLGGSCQKDEDCSSKGGDGGPHPVCYNLRCVECHYDGDCAEGKVCNTANQCSGIDSRTPEPEALPPPTTLEECAKRCKSNPTCGDSCRQQFKDAPK